MGEVPRIRKIPLTHFWPQTQTRKRLFHPLVLICSWFHAFVSSSLQIKGLFRQKAPKICCKNLLKFSIYLVGDFKDEPCWQVVGECQTSGLSVDICVLLQILLVGSGPTKHKHQGSVWILHTLEPGVSYSPTVGWLKLWVELEVLEVLPTSFIIKRRVVRWRWGLFALVILQLKEGVLTTRVQTKLQTYYLVPKQCNVTLVLPISLISTH